MAVPYYGDFAEDSTVRIPFNTFSSDDPSASVTITNLADADIMVHKDGGTTQIATDGATVSIDFDTITGNHYIVVDTSVHADYTTGSEYAVRVEGTTVDAATINAWVGAFSIERSGGALAILKASLPPTLYTTTITKGSTSQTLEFEIYKNDNTAYTGLVWNTSGLSAAYYRTNQATSATAITLATQTLGTWATGGFIVVDATKMPGTYQLSVPDAAFTSSAGVDRVKIQLDGAADMRPVIIDIQLVDSITLGSDNKAIISTDVQDLSATFDVNAKLIAGSAPTISAEGNIAANIKEVAGVTIGTNGTGTDNIGNAE